MAINKALAVSRGLTPERITALEEVTNCLNLVLSRPEMYLNTEQVPDVIQGLEYTLQWLWGFTMDKNKHTYWYRVKGCTCPKMDNEDNFGIDIRIVDGNCPYHGVNVNDSL